MNTWKQPFKVSKRPFNNYGDACMGAAGGQLPYLEGTQVQVSFILTIRDSQTDVECARLLMESFLTAREATSVQYSVYRELSLDSKAKEEDLPATIMALKVSQSCVSQQ